MSQQIPLSREFLRGLKAAEETYRHLVEGIPAIFYIDANDDLSTSLYTSPQIEEILGFTAEEWGADPALWLARMHEDDRERVLFESRRVNDTGEAFRTEYRLIAADGREVWVRDEAVLVRDDDGEPMFWRGFMFDITEQKRAEEKLRRSLDVLRRTSEERRALLQRLEGAQEEERRRIAADIHDDSIQVISAADLRVQALQQGAAESEMKEALAEVHETLKLSVDRLRHLLFELRPPALDREGLAAAIRTYLADSEGGPAYEVEDRLESEPASDVRATLYRIAQEAITNARKHADAGHIAISIASQDGGVLLRVADDGKGFDPKVIAAPEPGHIGLPTLGERAELAGGWWRVETGPGKGTVVEAWVPAASGATPSS